MARRCSVSTADYDQPLQIEEIAQELGMSVSSFYSTSRR
jgi:AraC-like DNA-binding protein